MKKLHFTVDIDAPAHHVWATMLDDTSYRDWASAFNPGPDSDSHFQGTWDAGSTIRFLGSDDNGAIGGMIATVVDNRPGEFVALEYVGQVVDGVDDTTSEDAQAMAGTHEVYSFSATDSGTRVTVNMDSFDEWAPMLAETWPLALARLKDIAESTS